MKALILFTFLTLNTNADVIKRPSYQPDENHPAPTVMMPRQAQEERIQKPTDKSKRQLEEEREKRRKAVEFFKETEMTE